MKRLMLLLLLACTAAGSEIAVTFDDLPLVTASDPIAVQQQVTREILAHLTSRKIPAVGLVNTSKLATPAHAALLDRWLEAGFELGNHTHSHPDLHRVGAEAFEEDIIKGETPLRDVIRRHRGTLRYFRHPFLHTGRADEVRARIDAFLVKRGYTVAPVTIDNSEWIFARAYEVAKDVQKNKVVDAYLDYMMAKVAYHDEEAKKLFDREIRQVLLVHANALNAAAFGMLADRLAKRGHRFITLSRALEDPAYQSPDGWRGAGGISWLDRWAIARGVPKTFFADEPRTPQWVQELAGIEE
ncbi:MAG: polysaccharide deacetylase family protein [Thermoanaerobaculia bacterium]